MVFVPMRHEDGVDMVDVIANQRRHHAVIEPTVDERHSATLTNQNRIGLTNIEDRHRRRRTSIPIDIRNTRCKHQTQQPHCHGPHAGAWPPDQDGHQRERHHIYQGRIGRHAYGCARNGSKELFKEQRTAGDNHGHHERPVTQQRHKRAGHQHNRYSEQHAYHRTDHGICKWGNERKRLKCGNRNGKCRQLRAQRDRQNAGDTRWHAQLAQGVGGVGAKTKDGKNTDARKLKTHFEQYRRPQQHKDHHGQK